MYEPFEQAIERFQPHPEHKRSRDGFIAFLEACDKCRFRVELRCPKCKCRGGGKSCIRLAELPNGKCPKGYV